MTALGLTLIYGGCFVIGFVLGRRIADWYLDRQ